MKLVDGITNLARDLVEALRAENLARELVEGKDL